MIQFEKNYLEYIQRKGVGSRDRVASSPASYVSYLRSVSRFLDCEISPKLLSSESDVVTVAQRLKGKCAAATIRNYCSAMRQYVAMVNDLGL